MDALAQQKIFRKLKKNIFYISSNDGKYVIHAIYTFTELFAHAIYCPSIKTFSY